MTEQRKYGLLQADLDAVVELLRENEKIEQIILFGSRAKGSYLAGSDIDIALKGRGLNLDDLLNARIKLEELSLPYKFDLVLYDRIKEDEIIAHINRVGVTL